MFLCYCSAWAGFHYEDTTVGYAIVGESVDVRKPDQLPIR